MAFVAAGVPWNCGLAGHAYRLRRAAATLREVGRGLEPSHGSGSPSLGFRSSDRGYLAWEDGLDSYFVGLLFYGPLSRSHRFDFDDQAFALGFLRDVPLGCGNWSAQDRFRSALGREFQGATGRLVLLVELAAKGNAAIDL